MYGIETVSEHSYMLCSLHSNVLQKENQLPKEPTGDDYSKI